MNHDESILVKAKYARDDRPDAPLLVTVQGRYCAVEDHDVVCTAAQLEALVKAAAAAVDRLGHAEWPRAEALRAALEPFKKGERDG